MTEASPVTGTGATYAWLVSIIFIPFPLNAPVFVKKAEKACRNACAVDATAGGL